MGKGKNNQNTPYSIARDMASSLWSREFERRQRKSGRERQVGVGKDRQTDSQTGQEVRGGGVSKRC